MKNTRESAATLISARLSELSVRVAGIGEPFCLVFSVQISEATPGGESDLSVKPEDDFALRLRSDN